MDDNWGDWNEDNIVKNEQEEIKDEKENMFLRKLRLPAENPFDFENNFSKTDKLIEEGESEEYKREDEPKKEKQTHGQIWEDVIESSVYDN